MQHTITIEKEGEGWGWIVRMGDTSSGPLCWEEVLGQVATLTHPAIGTPRFPMKAQAEWDAEDERRRVRMEAMRAEDAEKQTEARALLRQLVESMNRSGPFGAQFQQLLGKAVKLVATP